MKKRTLLLGLVGLSFVIVGCGGGGGSSDGGGSTPPPATEYYSVCVSKADSTSYSCLETCNDTTIDVGYYDSVDACTVAGDQWVSTFNHSDTPSTQEQKDGLVWINEIRRGTGLAEFQYNAKLEKATLAHENYLGDVADNYNVNAGHYEDNETYPSNYYTGREGTDRAIRAGYGGRYAGDVINFLNNNNTVVESLDGLMSAIYHRQALLWNNTNEIGIGGTERKFDFKAQPHLMGIKADREDYLRSISPVVVTYPFDGQTNVRKVFISESPDPLPNIDKPTGYPVSLDFNIYYVNSVEISYFKLYKEDGTEITNTKLLDKETDPNGRFTEYQFALFPLDVLDANATYRVEVGYVLNGESAVKEWSFTTRG
ncbi:putative periplasmic protein [hydrothermal vent metagenome]|uniref:Putative periplasmic protein n=1 Tax=hydrothermal vent metagenome TaxID=652676 RepID=A0A1W1BRE1_9ZZZZ